jgi:DNA-binding response OmpR family regulator
MDGLEVCAAIKEHHYQRTSLSKNTTIKKQAQITLAILMLTARDSFAVKAAGVKQGAEDYLTKPCVLRELVFHCQALARRSDLHQLTSHHITSQ